MFRTSLPPRASGGHVVTDRAFQHGAGGHSARWPAVDGAGERRPGALAQQVPEPHWVEADRDDHPVERDPLAFLLVVDLDDDLGLDRFEADDAAGQRADRLGPVEHLLDLDGEHAAVGALEELAAVTLGELLPAHGGVGVEAVLGEALTARVQHAMVGDELDGRALGEQVEQHGGDRPGGLAVADHAHLDRAAALQRLLAGPEGPAVEDARMVVGLAGQAERPPWRWLGRGRPRSTQSAKPSWWMR